MLLAKERELIAEYGRKMVQEGLVRGTGGNISIYDRNKDLMAISPSAKDYFLVTASDVVVTDLNAQVAEGVNKPSSEYRMHAIFYKKRKDINAVVHTHSPNAAALSCMRKDLPPIYYLQIIVGTDPIKCSDYALTGSEKLAEAAYKAMGEQNGALLANHGIITGAKNLMLAYYMAEQIEFAADLYLKAGAEEKLVTALSPAEALQMKDVFIREFYGGINPSNCGGN